MKRHHPNLVVYIRLEGKLDDKLRRRYRSWINSAKGLLEVDREFQPPKKRQKVDKDTQEEGELS